jgi:plastin-1
MTSLGVPVRHIAEDLRDGIKILQVLEKICPPGLVDWKKVNLHPKNTYAKAENANYCIQLGKQIKFSMVGIEGKDFTDGNRKLILAMVWQMMKLHVFSILQSISQMKNSSNSSTKGIISKETLIQWANEKVFS